MDAFDPDYTESGAGMPAAPSAPRFSSGTGSGSAYRQRAATKFRGVTKTSGTNSGVEKYDVQ